MTEYIKRLRSLIPLHELEVSAQDQIYQALELDFLLILAIMPDCHTGYTLPIGGVALLDNVISPEYVGYDIGCGMCYILTRILANKFFKTKKQRVKFFNDIHKLIPVGPTSREKGIDYDNFVSASRDKFLNDKVEGRLFVQLGTLGGGNHFIEIGRSGKGFVSVAIHSGSRNPGHSIAGYYMRLSRRVDTDLPKGFLHLHSTYGRQYLHDMNFALEYALYNRKIMMRNVLSLFGYNEHEIDTLIDHHMVNENHNHAIVDGSHVLHRKGATPADNRQIGIIPGSMKTGIYVTEGLGNPYYLNSSSHGAGRKMARKAAKKKIKLDVFKKQMHGIVCNVNKKVLDEAPDAYKNLHNVIKEQEGIVIKTIDYLEPLIVVKG